MNSTPAPHSFSAHLLCGRLPGRRVARALALLAGAMGGRPLERAVGSGRHLLPTHPGSFLARIGAALPWSARAGRRPSELAGAWLCPAGPVSLANIEGFRAGMGFAGRRRAAGHYMRPARSGPEPFRRRDHSLFVERHLGRRRGGDFGGVGFSRDALWPAAPIHALAGRLDRQQRRLCRRPLHPKNRIGPARAMEFRPGAFVADAVSSSSVDTRVPHLICGGFNSRVGLSTQRRALFFHRPSRGLDLLAQILPDSSSTHPGPLNPSGAPTTSSTAGCRSSRWPSSSF